MIDYMTPVESDHMLSLLYAYDDLDWREDDGVRQAVVPLYGSRPEFIRDDDWVKWWWGGRWAMAGLPSFRRFWEVDLAVILLHRDDRNGEDGA